MPFQKQTATATKSAIVVRRSAPMVPKRKYEAVLASIAGKKKKAREIAARRVGTLVGIGVGGAAGYIERTGKLSPRYTSPAVVGGVGAVLAFVIPETGMGKGKAGQMAAEAGAGMLTLAAYKLGLGQAVIGEDDTETGAEEETESAGEGETETGWQSES